MQTKRMSHELHVNILDTTHSNQGVNSPAGKCSSVNFPGRRIKFTAGNNTWNTMNTVNRAIKMYSLRNLGEFRWFLKLSLFHGSYLFGYQHIFGWHFGIRPKQKRLELPMGQCSEPHIFFFLPLQKQSIFDRQFQ